MLTQNPIHLIIAICFVMISPILAQDDGLEPDVPVTVELGDSPFWLSFEGNQGDRVTITTGTVNAESPVDTTLELLSPDNQRLAYADDVLLDDGTWDSHAQLVAIDLPESGTYLLRVDSFNGVSEGEVEVLLVIDDLSLTIIDEDNITTIQATIKQNEVIQIEQFFEADSDITVRVKDVSGQLDPVLIIRDTDGTILHVSDDHKSDTLTLNRLDAQLTFVVPDDGDYIIEIRDYLGHAGALEVLIIS